MSGRWMCVLVLALTCAKSPAPPPQPADLQPAASGPRVIFPDGTVIQVEIAADDTTRAQGLMFRDRVRPGTGMLFFFPQDGNFPFWMKNTLIPLDMIWIDQRKSVVAVKEHVPPCEADPCPPYDPEAPARYVLEVAAGVAREHRITPGTVLRFEGVDHVVVR